MSSERRRSRRLTKEEEKRKREMNEDLFNITQVKIIEKLKEKKERSLVIADNEFGQLRLRRDGSWILDLRTIANEMRPEDTKRKKRSVYNFVLEHYTLLTEYEKVRRITGREIEDSWEGSIRRYISLNEIQLGNSLLKSMQIALIGLNDPRRAKIT